MNSTKKEFFPPLIPKMLIIAINKRNYLLFLSHSLICKGLLSWEENCFCIPPYSEILYSSLWEEQKNRTHSSSAVTQLISQYDAEFIMLPSVYQNKRENDVCCVWLQIMRFQEYILLYQREEGETGPELILGFNVSCSFHSYSFPIYKRNHVEENVFIKGHRRDPSFVQSDTYLAFILSHFGKITLQLSGSDI